MECESTCGNKKRKTFLLAYRVFLTIPLAVIFMLSFVYGEESGRAAMESNKERSSALRDAWGIEIVRLKLTAASHIIDLRYRVVDPIKSFPIFDSKIKPVLIDEKSGRDLSVYTAPRIGGMRQKTKKPEPGRIYFILFSNPGGLIKGGSEVTLKIEGVKVEHIRVEEENLQVGPAPNTAP